MKRQGVTASAIRYLICGAILACMPSSASARDKEQDLLRKVHVASEKDDCRAVLRILRKPLDQDLLSDYSRSAREGLVSIGANCAVEARNFELGYRWTSAALDQGLKERAVVDAYLSATSALGKFDEVVRGIQVLYDGNGAALNRLPTDWLGQVDHQLAERSLTQARLALLAILADDSYIPEDSLGQTDGFKSRYALLLLDIGRTEEARVAAAQITSPHSLLFMKLSPGFAAIRPAELDLPRELEKDIENARRAVRNYPDSLQALIWIASTLNDMGRPQEALAVLLTAQERDGGPNSFIDSTDQLRWWWNKVADTHAALDQVENMEAALRQGATVPEDGKLNVSQILNLAWLQLIFGRPQAALDTLSDFATRSASSYGETIYRLVRSCAAHKLNHHELAATDLAFMRSAATADFGWKRVEAELCVGNLDEAAALVISQLADPKTQTTALLELADYDAPTVALTTTSPIKAALAEMKTRPDIIAAHKPLGGAPRIHLQAPIR